MVGALVTCVTLWLLGMGILTFGLFEQRGAPVEQATVMAVHESTEWKHCGRNSSGYGEITTFHVADPPPGLPAQWVSVLCPRGRQVGDIEPIARTGPSPDDVILDPVESIGDAALFATASFVTFPFFWVVIVLDQRPVRIRRPWWRR